MSCNRIVRAAAVAAAFIALPALASAQQAGVKAGVNFASVSEEPDEGAAISRRIGLVGGFWVRTAERSRVSFQIEGLYSEKGFIFTIDELPEFEGNLRVRYIEVPLLARIDLSPAGSNGRFHLVAGAAPALKIGARATATDGSNEESMDVGDEFESFDLGLVAGAGMEFGRGLIEARYTHGLLSIAKTDGSTGADPSVKNRTFTVMAGFRFR